MTPRDPQTGRFISPPSDHRPQMVDWAPEDRYAPVDAEPIKLDMRDMAALAIGVVAVFALLAIIAAVVAAWLGVL